MLTRLTITFTPDEGQALRRLAEADFRLPKEQLRYILRQAAEERGLWPPVEQQPDAKSVAGRQQSEGQ